jgi:hypothetical protein
VPAPQAVVAFVRGTDSEAPLRCRRRPDAGKVAQAQDSRGSSGASQTRYELSSPFGFATAVPSAALARHQLLALERAWFDGSGWFENQARGAA